MKNPADGPKSFQHRVEFNETKSLASGRSKGALFSSANAEMINKGIKGNRIKTLMELVLEFKN